MQIAALVASSSLAGSLAGRYLAAQLRGDRREALRLVELAAEVERERPHAVALSTAMIVHEPALREAALERS
jgi:hypothetical protein